MPAGRPTDYRPEYCASVVEFGRMGKSLTWMAAELGVAKSTLQLWEKEKPEFSVAMTQARALSQQWWEDAGQQSMLLSPGQGTFNASVWSRSMAARFPEDWRENKGVELTGAGGGPVEVRQVTFVAPDGE
jgi:DNA-binding XRE family transcriptional regulator